MKNFVAIINKISGQYFLRVTLNLIILSGVCFFPAFFNGSRTLGSEFKALSVSYEGEKSASEIPLKKIDDIYYMPFDALASALPGKSVYDPISRFLYMNYGDRSLRMMSGYDRVETESRLIRLIHPVRSVNGEILLPLPFIENVLVSFYEGKIIWRPRDLTVIVKAPRNIFDQRTAPGIDEFAAIGKLIIIDPGHGGNDYGVSGKGGLQEKNAAFEMADTLKPLISETLPCSVVLTRGGDYYVPLNSRIALINQNEPLLCVGLHFFIGGDTPEVRICRSVSLSQDDEAETIEEETENLTFIPLPERTENSELTEKELRAAEFIGSELMKEFDEWEIHFFRVPLFVQNSLLCPSVAVEFSINSIDFSDKNLIQQIARAMVNAIRRYLEFSDEV